MKKEHKEHKKHKEYISIGKSISNNFNHNSERYICLQDFESTKGVIRFQIYYRQGNEMKKEKYKINGSTKFWVDSYISFYNNRITDEIRQKFKEIYPELFI